MGEPLRLTGGHVHLWGASHGPTTNPTDRYRTALCGRWAQIRALTPDFGAAKRCGRCFQEVSHA